MTQLYCFTCNQYIDSNEEDMADYSGDEVVCGSCVQDRIDELFPGTKEMLNNLTVKPEMSEFISRKIANELIDQLSAELAYTKDQRDRYWEVYLAAKDVKDLDEMTGVPIKIGTRKKAVSSLNIVINDVEEWELA